MHKDARWILLGAGIGVMIACQSANTPTGSSETAAGGGDGAARAMVTPSPSGTPSAASTPPRTVSWA